MLTPEERNQEKEIKEVAEQVLQLNARVRSRNTIQIVEKMTGNTGQPSFD